jgi:serine/threonine protein phosphatase PrpC
MHPFQENLQIWLSRKLAANEENHCREIPLILSTDIGLIRSENQDRVAALYTGRKSINPLLVIAVADGMGGMRDGGGCANLALSSFFYSIIQHRNLDIKARANKAIEEANSQVFELYQGSGGSTLTAVLLDAKGNKIIVHLGDTRVYTFGPDIKVERHTTDDSLAEAVGGTGRELLQFVGMGESMQPKITDLTQQKGFCAVTTDGIHGLEEKTLRRILENSESIEQASRRLNSIAKWCGGIDNSTSAIFDIAEVSQSLAVYEGNGIRTWDSGGDLTTLWLNDEDQAADLKQPRRSELRALNYELEQEQPKVSRHVEKNEPKKPRAQSARLKDKKHEKQPQEKIQLDIEIGNSD